VEVSTWTDEDLDHLVLRVFRPRSMSARSFFRQYCGVTSIGSPLGGTYDKSARRRDCSVAFIRCRSNSGEFCQVAILKQLTQRLLLLSFQKRRLLYRR